LNNHQVKVYRDSFRLIRLNGSNYCNGITTTNLTLWAERNNQFTTTLLDVKLQRRLLILIWLTGASSRCPTLLPTLKDRWASLYTTTQPVMLYPTRSMLCPFKIKLLLFVNRITSRSLSKITLKIFGNM